MKSALLVIGAVIALGLSTQLAWAEDGGLGRGACRADSQSFCPKLTADALVSCLANNQARLSPACADKLSRAQSLRPKRSAQAACAGDVATFCAGVQKGGGRIIKCLLENQPNLSAACQTEINARLQAR